MKIQQILSKKSLFIIAGIVSLYTVIGFFIVPYVARNILEDKLSQALNRQVEIQNVAMNPYTFSAAVNALIIKEKNNDIFFSAQRVYANLSLSSLFTLSLVLSDVVVESPYISITRNPDGSFNFSDLLNKDKSSQEDSGETKESNDVFHFVLEKAAVQQGRILFKDKLEKTDHEMNGLDFSLASLSNKSKKRYQATTLEIDFVLNGTPVNIHTKTTPFAEDLATSTQIWTENIDALHYLSYLPLPDTIKLKDLDLNLDINGELRKIKNAFSLVIQGSANALNADIKSSQDQNILNFPELSINLEPSDILDGKVNIAEIALSSPTLNLSRDANGELNLIKHLPDSNSEKKETPVEDKKMQSQAVAKIGDKPLHLTLGLFELKDGRIIFKDGSNQDPFETTIYPLDFKIEDLKAEEDITGSYAVEFATGQKENIQSSGTFGLIPFKTKGQIAVVGLDFQHYAPYYEKSVDLSIKQGRLDLSCDFDLVQNENAMGGIIRNKSLQINDLAVYERDAAGKISDNEMVGIPEFMIQGSSIDLGNKKLSTGTILSKNGNIHLKRLKDGKINLVKSVIREQTKNSSGNADKSSEQDHQEPSADPWTVNINTLDIENYSISFEDISNNDPVKINLSKAGFHADNLQTAGNQKGNISANMNWNKAGRISMSGGLDLAKLNGDFDIDIKKIDIKSLQPYFTDTVKILVTKGDIHTKGKLELNLDQTKEQIRFKGDSSVTDFICLDKKTAKDFFKCNSLYVSEIAFSSTPIVLEAKDISLTDFYSRVIVNETGEMNIASILENEESKEKELPKEKPAKETPADPQHGGSQIKIANVTLQGGNINFSDYFTNPNFTADMKKIAGSVTGLSSEPGTRAILHMQGVHGESSPLEIVGTINPLAQKKFLDIDISYKDIELTDFTPYAAKFLGYKIEKGKLILDLEYTIDGTSLKSENRARFDNFTLGESVDSEHATSLPVSLAISLLKDGDGQINLDLPVTGELNDPEFSVAGIVLKMIGNLVLKAATSPFSIIGAMFGGGEDLGYVEFEFGNEQIDTPNSEKLDTLVKILEKKPTINLEIKGMYHPEHDAENLRIKGYYDLLKAQKLQDMIKKGSASGTLENVRLNADEIEKFAHQAYAEAAFPKPRDAEGKEKKIELQEKVKLLKTNVNVTKDDLRLLAINRSKAIKAYIISNQSVDKERVFILEPGEMEESEQSSQKSEARFSLKEK